MLPHCERVLGKWESVVLCVKNKTVSVECIACIPRVCAHRLPGPECGWWVDHCCLFGGGGRNLPTHASILLSSCRDGANILTQHVCTLDIHYFL